MILSELSLVTSRERKKKQKLEMGITNQQEQPLAPSQHNTTHLSSNTKHRKSNSKPPEHRTPNTVTAHRAHLLHPSCARLPSGDPFRSSPLESVGCVSCEPDWKTSNLSDSPSHTSVLRSMVWRSVSRLANTSCMV